MSFSHPLPSTGLDLSRHPSRQSRGDSWITTRSGTIDDILGDLDNKTKAEYLETDTEVRLAYQDLEALSLPPASGPPAAPQTASARLDTQKPTKKKPKSRKSRSQKSRDYLISTQIIKTGKPPPVTYVTPPIDLTALSRVLKSRDHPLEKELPPILEPSPIYNETFYQPMSWDTGQSGWRNPEDANALIRKELSKKLPRRTLSARKDRNEAERSGKIEMGPGSMIRESISKAVVYVPIFIHVDRKTDSHHHVPASKTASSSQKYASRELKEELLRRTSLRDIDENHKTRLDAYDDLFYEKCSPLEWLASAKAENQRGVRAFSRYYHYHTGKSDWDWLPCLVLDYDSESKTYLIEWIPSGTQKRANRLNILFEDESKELFYQRIEHAVKLRNAAELQEKYRQTIITLKTPPIAPLPKSMKLGILTRIGRPITVGDMDVISSCMKEIESEYIFSIKKADYEARHGVMEDRASIKSQRFAQEAIARSGAHRIDIDDILYKKVAVATKVMSEYMFSANPNVQKAIVEILGSLDRLLPSSSGFFMSDLSYPIEFSKFVDRTLSHSEAVQALLTHRWPSAITRIIETYLGNFLDMKQTNVFEYENSRAKDFLRLVDIIMETQTQNLVIEASKRFLDLFGMEVESLPGELIQVKKVATDIGKTTHKFRYRISKPFSFSIPFRFIIRLTLSFQKDQGHETLKDMKNFPIFKTRPGNALVMDPKSLESVQNTINSLYMTPYKMTKKTIPKVETMAFPGLHFGDSHYLETIDIQDDILVQGPVSIQEMIAAAWPVAESTLNSFQKFAFLAREDVCGPLEDENDLEPFEEITIKLVDAKNAIYSKMARIEMAPFILDCTILREALIRIASQGLEKVCLILGDKISESCDFLITAYTELDTKINVDPGQDAQKWKDLTETLEVSELEFEDYDSQFSHIGEIWDLMYRLNLRIPNTVAEKYWATYRWPNVIREHFNYCKSRLQAAYDQIAEQIRIDCEFIRTSYDAYKADIATMNIDDIERTDDMFVRVTFLKKRLERVSVLADEVEKRCDLIDVPLPFSFEPFRYLVKNFHHFETLWTTAKDARDNLNQWTGSLFIDLNAELVIKKAQDWSKTVSLLSQIFSSSVNPMKILQEVKVHLDDFSRNTNIITALRNPALRNRHWDLISKVIGLSLHDFSGLRLRQVMDLDLEMVQDILLDISMKASDEYQIETALDSMRSDMSSKEFVLVTRNSVAFLDDGYRALAIIEDSIIASEHLLKLDNACVMTTKIDSWIVKLSKAQSLLTNILELQNLYSLLLPAFSTYSSLLEGDTTTFSSVTKFLVTLSEIFQKNHKYIVLILRSDLHDSVRSALKRLESSKYMISQVIQIKRDTFSRFYFLSETDILHMLSCKKDINRINKYISKCFIGIKSLNAQMAEVVDTAAKTKMSFLASRRLGSLAKSNDESNAQSKKRWTALKVGLMMRPKQSSSKASVDLSHTNRRAGKMSTDVGSTKDVKERILPGMVPKDTDNIQVFEIEGHFGEKLELDSPMEILIDLEAWLPKLGSRIKSSMFSIIKKITEKNEFIYSEALLKWPSQICHLICLLSWNKAFSALTPETHSSVIAQLKNDGSKQLDDLIKSLDAYKSAYLRRATEFAISQIQCLLQQLEFQRALDPEYLYYFKFFTEDSENITIRTMYSSFKYGFEFYGNKERLILTPVMCRTMSYMMQNIQFQCGTSLVGPPASCKSELVSELAALMGYRLFVMDSNIFLGRKGFLSLLEGCVLSETWICLNNPTLVSKELSSLISEHVFSLRKLLQAKGANSNFIYIGGRKINLHNRSIQPIFATLDTADMKNWHQMPDNIRSLFRPLAVRIPCVSLLAETVLAACSFSDCKSLASKLSITISSLKSMLSLSRLNFGATILKQILDLASSYRLQEQAINSKTEQSALGRAILKFVLPFVSISETAIVKDIIKSAFPDLFQPEKDISNHWLREVITKDMGLAFVDSYVKRLDSIFDILSSQQCVIITGHSKVGKTTAIKILQKGIQKQRVSEGTDIKLSHCYYNSIPEDELMGSWKEDRWSNGILPALLTNVDLEANQLCSLFKPTKARKDPFHSSIGYGWVLLHGDLNARVCDPILDLIQNPDSYESLCDNALQLSSTVKLIFESQNLADASPALISRCALLNFGIHLENNHIYETIIVSDLPSYITGHEKLLSVLFNEVLEPLLSNSDYQCNIGASAGKSRIASIVKMFTCLLKDYGSDNYDRLVPDEQRILLFSQYILSIIWTIGTRLDQNARYSFDKFLKKTILSRPLTGMDKSVGLSPKSLESVQAFPSEGSVFDYYFEIKLFKWRRWTSLTPEMERLSGKNMLLPFDIEISQEIIVHSFFYRLLLNCGQNILLVGPKGSGKSTLAKVCLRRENFPGYDKEIPIIVDPSTGSSVFRAKLNSSLCKLKEKSRSQNNRITAFVDDLNSVSSNAVHTKELVSILKMCFETKGMHHLKSPSHMQSLDNFCMAAVLEGVPGQCPKNFECIMDFFHIFSLNADEEQRLNMILEPAVRQAFSIIEQGGREGFSKLLIKSTVDIAQRLRKSLPQTPKYAGYVFSTREIIVVLQGLVTQTDMKVSLKEALDIWEHQCLRIFGDCLVSAEHLHTLKSEIDRELRDTFSVDLQKKENKCVYICGNRYPTDSTHKRNNQVFNAHLPTRLGNMCTLQDICNEIDHDPTIKVPLHFVSLESVQECLQMSFNLVENHRNILMAGSNLGNRQDMVQIACWLSNAHFIVYEPDRISQVWEHKTKWENTLVNSHRKANDTQRLHVLYLDYSRILYEWQWEDIKLMLNDEIPVCVISELFPFTQDTDGNENQEHSNLEEKLTSASQLSRLLKLVISFPESIYLRNILRDRPFLLKNSTIHWGHPWTHINIHSITSTLLNNSQWFHAISETQRTLIQKFWAFIYEDAYLSSDQEYHETRQKLSVPNDFILFGIQYFKSIFGKKLVVLNQQTERLQSALKKIERDIRAIDAMESLYFTRLKNSEEITERVDNFLKKIESERELIDRIKSDLRKETDQFNKSMEEGKTLTSLLESDTELELLKYSSSAKNMNTLTKAELLELKTATLSSMSMQSLLRIVCILFGYEQRGSETFADCTRRLLSESRFYNSLMNFDPNSVTGPIIIRVEEYLKDIDGSALVVKAAGCLYSWVQALVKYHRDMEALQPRMKLVSDIKIYIEDLKSSIEKSKNKLVVLEPNMLSMKAHFDTLMKQKEEAAALFRESDICYRSSQILKTALNSSRDRWKADLQKKNEEEQVLMSSSLVTAAFVSCMGSFSFSTRQTALNRWFVALETMDPSSVQRDTFSISAFLMQSYLADIFVQLDLPFDPILLDTVQIAKYHEKYPILWDPYGRIIPWIVAVDRESRIEVMRSKDDDFNDKITNAALRGVRVIVQVHEGVIGELVEELLDGMSSSKDGVYLRVNGDLVRVENNFRIYFIVNEPLSRLTNHWVHSCITIQCPHNLQTIENTIADNLLSGLQPSLREEVRKIDLDASHIQNKRELFANRGIDFVMQLKDEDLISGDLHRTVIENDEQASALQYQLKGLASRETERNDRLKWFKTIAAPIAEIFMTVDQLSNLSLSYYFDFNWYLEICHLAYRQLSPLDHHQLKQNIKQFAQTIFLIISPGLSKAESILFGFHLALTVDKYTQEKQKDLQDEYFDFFVNQKVRTQVSQLELPAFTAGKNPIPWIADSVWETLSNLSKWPQYRSFVENFVVTANRTNTSLADVSWEDVLTAINPITLKFPASWQSTLSPLDRIIILFCIRPDVFASSLEHFRESLMPSKGMEIPIDVLMQRYRFSSISNPIWIINKSSEDTLTMIKHFSGTKGMANYVTIMNVDSIIKGNLHALMDALLDSMRRGRWLVLTDCDNAKEIMSACDTYFKYLLNTLVDRNGNFRLWILSRELDQLPMFLTQRSIKLHLEKNRDLRIHLNDGLVVFEEHMAPTEIKVSTLYRRLVFNLMAMISMVRNRRRFVRSQLNVDYDIKLDDLQRAVRLLRKEYPSYAPLLQDTKSLYARYLQVVEDFAFGSQTFDDWDERFLKTLFSKFAEVNWADLERASMPPLKHLYEHAQKGEIPKCLDAIRSFPTDNHLTPIMFGLDESSQYFPESMLSSLLIQSFQKYHQGRQFHAPKDIDHLFTNITVASRNMLQSIKDACTGCFDLERIHHAIGDPKQSLLEINSKKIHLYATKPAKFMEHVLRMNIKRYRAIIIDVNESLENLIMMLEGHAQLDQAGEKMAAEISQDKVPLQWTSSGQMYPTCRGLSSWIADFCSRLKFINEWHNVRQNPTLVNKGSLVVYDISKMFSPKAFLDAILHDYAAGSHEIVENLEFEVAIFSGRQTMLPDRGFYLTGLHLLEAGWDFSKGVMRETKPREDSQPLPCIWVQPVVKQEDFSMGALASKIKVKTPSRRNGQKFECPVYIYKPNSAYINDISDDSNSSNVYYRDLYIESFYISSMESEKHWIERNVCMVCELAP